jgi:hypothetical protein
VKNIFFKLNSVKFLNYLSEARLCLIFLFLLSPLIGEAKIVGLINDTHSEIDFQKPTHILTFGYSHGMGTLFIESALTRAYRYSELFPNNQLIIIGNREKKDVSDLQVFKKFGIQVVQTETDLKPFTSVTYFNFLLQFKAIQSIDFFSHTSMHSGPSLENSKQRFNAQIRGIAELKSHFLPNAFIFLHGCNGGFLVAPELSKTLEVPVAGALTSTDFQKIHKDQNWYTNSTDQYPSVGSWQKSNSISFARTISCHKGACTRMRPDNHPYRGSWGTYSGGLPFYKFFCNYELNQNHTEQDCYRSMALSLLAWPSTINLQPNGTMSEFKEVLLDFMCPTDRNRKVFNHCKMGIETALLNGNTVFSPFKGNNTECSIKQCNIKTSCLYDDEGDAVMGTCKVATPKNLEPKTMIEEIQRYIVGFKDLEP